MAATMSPSPALIALSLLALGVAVWAAPGQLHPIFGDRKEKLSHLRFYFHEIVSGRNPSIIQLAKAPTTNLSAHCFGEVAMIDDPLMEGSDLKSKLLARAKGIYACASQNDVGLMMNMSFVFVTGKYNGSTLSVLGRNAVLSGVRETPVVTGSGLFRGARGYVQARTHWFDMKAEVATVEYNVYVMHY